ncbi:MAG: Isochorismatase family [Actinomycetia bacterium]|nr:Isochorismatase family [Actinomycetes bacterium]
MTSEPIRDPQHDHLLTPENSALVIIDYQPVQLGSIRSMDRDVLVANIVRVARTASLYRLPIVLSTVNVKTGVNQPTIDRLLQVLPRIEPIDRTTMNSWEDVAFRDAVLATGRKKLIVTALWTEVCLAFPALDAMRDGFETYPVVDAVGGTSREAHRAAIDRLTQAGAKPLSWVQMLCELQRDWARTDTAAEFADILFHST